MIFIIFKITIFIFFIDMFRILKTRTDIIILDYNIGFILCGVKENIYTKISFINFDIISMHHITLVIYYLYM